jgi:hypothetical protein
MSNSSRRSNSSSSSGSSNRRRKRSSREAVRYVPPHSYCSAHVFPHLALAMICSLPLCIWSSYAASRSS